MSSDNKSAGRMSVELEEVAKTADENTHRIAVTADEEKRIRKAVRSRPPVRKTA